MLNKNINFDILDSSVQFDCSVTENKMNRHISHRKCLNFYPDPFSPLAFLLSHIAAHCQATQAYTQTKACQRAAILPTQKVYLYLYI